jgi:hypothetical protein
MNKYLMQTLDFDNNRTEAADPPIRAKLPLPEQPLNLVVH